MPTANSSTVKATTDMAPGDASRRSIVCREGDEIKLSEAEVECFEKVATNAADRQEFSAERIVCRTANGLRAGDMVGVLATRERTLEILPKIEGNNVSVRHALVHMIAETRGFHPGVGDAALMGVQHQNLLDCLVRFHGRQMLAAVRRGIPRRYAPRRDDLPTLRGRLDVPRQFTRFAYRADRIACDYDELTVDTPLGRVLKASARRMMRFVRSHESQRLMAELAGHFENIADSVAPLRERVQIDRTNAAFRDLYRRACLLLEGDFQSTTGGSQDGYALLFPIGNLFEEFVGCILKRASPYPVRLQRGKHRALKSENGQQIFQLQPDAVIESPNGIVILDTKWKSLDPVKLERNVKSSDVYQMLAYANAYSAKHLVLIYPWHGNHKQPAGLECSWKTNHAECPFDVATIDVARPSKAAETLRGIPAFGWLRSQQHLTNHPDKAQNEVRELTKLGSVP